MRSAARRPGTEGEPALTAWYRAGDDPHAFAQLYTSFRARIHLSLQRAGLSSEAAERHLATAVSELERRRSELDPDTTSPGALVDEVAAAIVRALSEEMANE